MTISAGVFFLYTSAWHANCFFLGSANLEVRKYIRQDFKNIFGVDSIDVNMVASLYNKGTKYTVTRAWSINYVEVIALGAFVFCDPIAIVICLPVFRRRVMCQKKQLKRDDLPKTVEATVTYNI
uniref:G_PROTEIN_RECEP_F1_2 domain-containing protein n=1 Tax=Caenorhabditis tropicalis TaxID=1561998 RepID=A0A1I7T224_9PELO